MNIEKHMQMNEMNTKGNVFYIPQIELFLVVGLLFSLPFHGITTVQEILYFSLLITFIIHHIFIHKNIYSMLSFPDKRLNILMILSFCWGYISLLNALDPYYSFQELSIKMSRQYFLYFITFFIVRELPMEKVKWVLFSIVTATLIMSVAACFQFYQNPVFVSNRVHGFTGAFYRLATFLVLSLPILAVLIFLSHGWVKRLFVIIITLGLFALFFTFTRAAWIAVVVEAIVLIVIFLKKYRKALLILILTTSIIIIALSKHSILPQKVIVHGTEKPRIEALHLSLELISENPFAGIGYGKQTFAKYYPEVFEVRHAHNIFLNVAIEMGLIGLIFFIGMLIVIIQSFVSSMKKETILERKLMLGGIFASVLGFLSLNLFDYMYHGWPGEMFWIFVGIGYALIKSKSNNNFRTGD
jgi:O-antigen ligase